MKIRATSWVLAAGYLLFGVWLFVAVPRFRLMYSEMQVTPQPMTRYVLAVPALVWLALLVFLAAAIVLKDFRYRSHLLNLVFTAMLLCFFAVLMSGLLVAEFTIATPHAG